MHRIRLMNSTESSVIFRLIGCETHAAPAGVRSIRTGHEGEYIYTHPAMLRGGLGLNAASTWDTCLPRDYRWFIPTVQRKLVQAVCLGCYSQELIRFCYWISFNKDVSHSARLGATEWRGMHQFDLEKKNVFFPLSVQLYQQHRGWYSCE